MILHPGVLSLLVSSLLTLVMTLAAAGFGVQILRHWDLASGSERQLVLERRTYLVSTIVSYTLGLQLISIFLFLYTVDDLSSLFVGAMCAVGSLSAGSFGYPTLLLKIATFLLAALWLILNHADSRGYDYPLIRWKQLLLLVLAPLILAEFISQAVYFLALHPDIITSCCGSLFSARDRTLATELANAPPLPMLALFYTTAGLAIAAGLRFRRRGRGAYPFALLSAVQLAVALVAVVSVISLYIYRMPSHHCPFCILQKEYLFIGYPLYLSIMTAGVCGIGVGMLHRFRSAESLGEALPSIQRRLAAIALWALALLMVLATVVVVFTSFTLRG